MTNRSTDCRKCEGAARQLSAAKRSEMLEGFTIAAIDHDREAQVRDLLVPVEDGKHPALPFPLALNASHPVGERDRVRFAQRRDGRGDETAGIGKRAYTFG